MIFGVLVRFLVNLLRTLAAPFLLARRRSACPPGRWVALEIDGRVRELPVRRRYFWQRPSGGLSIARLRELVDAMKDDPSPAGLVVTVRSMNSSPAQRTAIAGEFARLRAAGKRVVVYLADGGSSPELAIAAVADRVLLGAETMLGPLGFRVGGTYSRRALDRLGVVPDVHAQGAFKTAGEGLVRDEMSDAQREQLGRIVEVFHDELVTTLAVGRKVDRATASGWLDRGLLSAAEAVEAGLADGVVFDDQLARALDVSPPPDLADAPPPPAPVGAAGYLARRRARVWRPLRRRARIGVVEMHGAIVERPPTPFGSFCDSDRVCRLLAAAADDRRTAAVLVHLDSPGGGVVASARIHHAVTELAKKKPVIAYFDGVSASGGYYIGSAAHAIVAQPTTITGSIGVVAARLVFGPLLDRLGVSPQVVTRGRHADMFNATRAFTDDEARIFDDELARSYREFVAVVAAGRKTTPEHILPLAGGRVWMGTAAFVHGLVDKLGGFDVAVAEAKTRLGALGKDAEVALLVPPRSRRPPVLGLPARGALVLLEQLGLTALSTRLALALGTADRVLALWEPLEP